MCCTHMGLYEYMLIAEMRVCACCTKQPTMHWLMHTPPRAHTRALSLAPSPRCAAAPTQELGTEPVWVINNGVAHGDSIRGADIWPWVQVRCQRQRVCLCERPAPARARTATTFRGSMHRPPPAN